MTKNNKKQDKTRQDTRHDTTGQHRRVPDRTRPDTTWQGQGRARKDKTRHDTTRHDTTRQSKTRQDTTRYDTTRHGTARQDRDRQMQPARQPTGPIREDRQLETQRGRKKDHATSYHLILSARGMWGKCRYASAVLPCPPRAGGNLGQNRHIYLKGVAKASGSYIMRQERRDKRGINRQTLKRQERATYKNKARGKRQERQERQDKTRQDKTKTRQDKTRPNKTKQNKTRRDETHDKTRDKTRHKTTQKTTQDKNTTGLRKTRQDKTIMLHGVCTTVHVPWAWKSTLTLQCKRRT